MCVSYGYGILNIRKAEGDEQHDLLMLNHGQLHAVNLKFPHLAREIFLQPYRHT
jgi:hypothetical protein